MRIVNELLADGKNAPRVGAGVKIGDFGLGGRVYEGSVRRAARGDGGDGAPRCPQCPRSGAPPPWLAVVAALVAAVALCLAERAHFREVGAVKEAEGAVVLGTPAAAAANNGRLVFVAADGPALAGSPPRDPLLGVSAPSGFAIAKRVTEFCQWQEASKSERIIARYR